MAEKLDQGQCCKRDLERMCVQEEISGTTRMQQQHKVLRPKRAITFGKLEIIKQTVRTSITLQKMYVKTLWRGQPPPQRKKRLVTTD
jgi:hypothetical protein